MPFNVSAKLVSSTLIAFFACCNAKLQDYSVCNSTTFLDICPYGNFSNICKPHKYHHNLQCNYIKCCCPDTIDDGLIDYLHLQYIHFHNIQY